MQYHVVICVGHCPQNLLLCSRGVGQQPEGLIAVAGKDHLVEGFSATNAMHQNAFGMARDLDTIRLALTAAETGHLVFATLHTSSAA